MTFIHFDICNPAATLPVLYSLTLFENSESWEKLLEVTFVHCNICYGMASLLFDLDLLLSRSNNSNVNILKTVRAGAKTQQMTFVDFNIFYRMSLLPMLYSLPWPIFHGQIFIYFLKNVCFNVLSIVNTHINTTVTGLFGPRTIRPLDYSARAWTIRLLDCSAFGLFVLWSIRPFTIRLHVYRLKIR